MYQSIDLIPNITDLYDAKIGVIIMLAIWFVGGALVALIFGARKNTLAVGKLVIIVEARQAQGTIVVHDAYQRLRVGQG